MLIAHEKLETSGVHDSVIGANPFSAISESRARKTGGGSLQSNPPPGFHGLHTSKGYLDASTGHIEGWMHITLLRFHRVSSQGIP